MNALSPRTVQSNNSTVKYFPSNPEALNAAEVQAILLAARNANLKHDAAAIKGLKILRARLARHGLTLEGVLELAFEGLIARDEIAPLVLPVPALDAIRVNPANAKSVPQARQSATARKASPPRQALPPLPTRGPNGHYARVEVLYTQGRGFWSDSDLAFFNSLSKHEYPTTRMEARLRKCEQRLAEARRRSPELFGDE